MSVIGVGIVGLGTHGGWAARSHLPALRALPGYEVRALSTRSASSAAEAGRMHGVPLTFGSAAELAMSDEVDLVVISVRVPYHRELVTAALAAGKPVWCEWPLGNGVAEAREMTDDAAQRGLPTAVGLQARFSPTIAYVRDLIAGGYVGEVLSTTVTGSGSSWGAQVPPPAYRYLLDRRNGATMLTIPFAHTLDGVAHVLGEPGELRAMTATRRPVLTDPGTGEQVPMTASDQIAVTGVLAGGAVAALHYRGGLSRGTNLRWEINGTDGDLVLTGPTGHLQYAPLTLHGANGAAGDLEPLPVPERYHLVPALRDQPDSPVYAVAHAYQKWLEDPSQVPDFAHAVRRHETLETISPRLRPPSRR